MGLLKDAFGPAFGAGQVNNGMNGALSTFKKGFGNKGASSSTNPMDSTPQYRGSGFQSPQRQYEDPNSGRPQQYYQNPDPRRPQYQDQYLDQRSQRQRRGQDSRRAQRQYRDDDPGRRRRDRRSRGNPGQEIYDGYAFSDQPPPYGAHMSGYGLRDSRSPSFDYEPQHGYSQYEYDTSSRGMQPPRRPQNAGFRPLALPQVAYGKGKPFLRGYSDDLQSYGISEQEFIKIVDSLNGVIIPNPEAQIFEKAASITGYFVPGAEHIGILASRMAVGLTSAIGNGTMLSKTLSQANLRLFVPQGLEICIGKGSNVDQEAGISSASHGFHGAVDPEQKLAQYGDYLMPITVVYPEQKKAGRQDPIAKMGQGMSAKDAQKQLQGAMKEQGRGRRTKKGDSLEADLQWLIVRKAAPDSTARWQKILQQSEAALAQEQAQSSNSSGR